MTSLEPDLRLTDHGKHRPMSHPMMLKLVAKLEADARYNAPRIGGRQAVTDGLELMARTLYRMPEGRLHPDQRRLAQVIAGELGRRLPP